MFDKISLYAYFLISLQTIVKFNFKWNIVDPQLAKGGPQGAKKKKWFFLGEWVRWDIERMGSSGKRRIEKVGLFGAAGRTEQRGVGFFSLGLKNEREELERREGGKEKEKKVGWRGR